MTMLRIPSKLLMGVALAILCSPQFLHAQAAPQVSAQATTPGAGETRTGCLASGTKPGTMVLTVDMTGQQLSVVGPLLDSVKMDQRVTLTGTLARRDNIDVFEVSKVDNLNSACQVGFSPDALKKSIGKASLGARAGITLDPELITLGAQLEFGPIFRNVWARPSVDFGFGEVTKIISINPEAVYYLPFIGYGANQSRWNTYIGAGPTFTFSRKSFEGFPDAPSEDVTDWGADAGMTIFVGMTQRNVFFEVRAAAWSEPNIRLYMGYRFK